MAAFAALHIAVPEFVDEVSITDERPRHLHGRESGAEHLLDGFAGHHASDIYQGQLEDLAELQGILEEICVLVRDGRNDPTPEQADHGL